MNSGLTEIIKFQAAKRGWKEYSVRHDSMNLNSITGIAGKKFSIKTGIAIVYAVTAEVLQPVASASGLLCAIDITSDTGTKQHYTTNRKALFADPVGLPATPWIYESISEVISVHERELKIDSVVALSPGALIPFANIQLLLIDKVS